MLQFMNLKISSLLRFIIVFLFLFPTVNIMAQLTINNFHYNYQSKYSVDKVWDLPPYINETSGLYFDGESIWTINDGDNPSQIFEIKELSSPVNKINAITLPIKNNDWEAITGDKEYFYIGDFGNNQGNRKNLCIYKINKDSIKNNNRIHVDTIQFNYPEQTNFESRFFHNFDCESMILYGDSIYIFTKNWQNRHSEIYVLANKKGHQQAKLIGSFNAKMLITDACLDNDVVYFTGYNLKGKQFIATMDFGWCNSYRKYKIKLKHGQIEGICYSPQLGFLLSTERRKSCAAKIFTIKP